ncbi:MAG TPA: hypothetical protein VGX51_13775 [Solirubrobacteraceae bacterium]|jgi:hypothetical protein|nr:hypothetical protein [Solirubrobacteraceae bacterium]
MATRAIVTSQPDIACYVCGRRLLRGEQPEVFLVDGRPQNVCELCSPRAAHQGWPRGGAEDADTQPELQQRIRPGLFSRLWRGPQPRQRSTRARAPVAAVRGSADAGVSFAAPAFGVADDPLDPPAAAGDPSPAGNEPLSPGAVEQAALERALEAFNRGEYPRRIAGLTRSLGLPEVSAVYDRDLNLVTVLVAWELCWYRYRVDLDDPQLEARMVAEGRTLEQLPRGERLANATIGDAGTLSLAGAAV